jgi:hypothetical protein
VNARVIEASGISALAVVLTIAVALPVLQAPSDRIFGKDIVGRHHDPFTVMEQFSRTSATSGYFQPATDLPGALFARVAGPVAGYNWLVLLTFPLSAVTAYLLARHLALGRGLAGLTAILFAFSPFHLAHAAYHPHIAQTQWIPLFLLTLWRCLDRSTWKAIVVLGVAGAGVALSNFYGGLIAVVITPAAVAAYWFFKARAGPAATRSLVLTIGSLAVLGCAAIAYDRYAAASVMANPAAYGVPRADLFRYSAKWWSYFVPPVAHPLLGGTAQRIWGDAGVSVGVLEQQVSLGWGVVGLGLVAIYAWILRRAISPSLFAVPVLVSIALLALVCSLSPERTVGSFTFVRPSAFFYSFAPMFRSYARFGVIVQLMAALLAAIGVDQLRRSAARPARILCAALLVLAASEYAVWPPAMWRDVLPTSAHRWVAQLPDPVHALDCAPLTTESRSIGWLTASRISLKGEDFDDCSEPNLAEKLSARGYTHVLLRGGTPEAEQFAGRPAPAGLQRAAQFRDGEVLAVTALSPVVYTARMASFHSREFNQAWTWRWMGRDAYWSIVNATDRPIRVAADVEMTAFHRARRLQLLIDGHELQTVIVDIPRGLTRIGPFILPPGAHQLALHAIEPPTIAHDLMNNGDTRALSFAVGTWQWITDGVRP